MSAIFDEPIPLDAYPDPPHDSDPDDIPDHILDRLEAQRKAETNGHHPTTNRKAAPATQRVPPHNLAAEESLLGAMLLSTKAIDAAVDLVGPDDFYKPAHGHIYAAITALAAAGQPVDTVTVHDQLGNLATAATPAALTGLLANTPATTNAARYARIVAEHATLRRLIRTATDIVDRAYELPDDPAQLIALAADQIDGLLPQGGPGGAVHLADTLPDYLDLLEARFEGTAPAGITTGFVDLDHLLGGLRAGQLITICGRPGMGKSAVGGQLALNAAASGSATFAVSVEMGLEELQDRWLSSTAKLDATALRDGKISPRDWERISTGIGELATRPIHVLDDPGATVARIRAAARRIDNLGLVIVDYLQLMDTTTGHENRQTAVAALSGGLKRLARDLRCPVVALAQLNRSVELRADKRPQLSDLRESGAIENDSDVVLGLYRDEYYREESPDRGTLEVIVLKQRAGPTGMVRLAYQAHQHRIDSMARMDP